MFSGGSDSLTFEAIHLILQQIQNLWKVEYSQTNYYSAEFTFTFGLNKSNVDELFIKL